MTTVVIALASFIAGVLYMSLIVALAALSGQDRPGSVIPGPERNASNPLRNSDASRSLSSEAPHG